MTIFMAGSLVIPPSLYFYKGPTFASPEGVHSPKSVTLYFLKIIRYNVIQPLKDKYMKNGLYIPKDYEPTQLAYLAGIIDGEGSIYIGNYSFSKKTGDPLYQTNLEVSNTDECLIDWIVYNFGGKKYEYTPKQTPKNSRKKVFRWACTGEMLTHICPLILPYIVIKKRQCEIMIEMRKTFEFTGCFKGNRGNGAISRVPSEILQLRKSLFDEIRSLHCRNYLK